MSDWLDPDDDATEPHPCDDECDTAPSTAVCPLRDTFVSRLPERMPWHLRMLVSTAPFWLTGVMGWGSFVTLRVVRDETRWQQLEVPTPGELANLELRLTQSLNGLQREFDQRLAEFPGHEFKQRVQSLETHQQTLLQQQARLLELMQDLRSHEGEPR